MLELGLTQVIAGIQSAFERHDIERAEYLLWTALDQYPDLPALWFFAANIQLEKGQSAMAVQSFRRAIELEDNPIFWANLGAAYRRMNKTEEARRCLTRALEIAPTDGSALTNMCATYVNEGLPEEGIRYGEAALKSKQGERAMWNLALLYLEAGRFAEGFAAYHKGVNHERQLRTFTAKADREKEPKLLEPEYERAGKTLVVYGEQGLGDELLFGTVLPDALEDFGHVIFECHPRMEALHRRAHAQAIEQGKLTIHPTRKDAIIEWPHQAGPIDYKAPIGDLCHLYRNSREDFKAAWDRRGPIYSPPEAETARYRERLLALADGRRIVGFSMRGGVMQTNRLYRSIRPEDLAPLFRREDLMLVALDYEDITRQVEWFANTYGKDRYYWFPSITHGWDWGDHTAALIAACDLTVSVCQSAAHLSAAMGRTTYVLTPSRPAWRYGLTGEEWFPYPAPNVKLLRQSETIRNKPDWSPAIARLLELLDGEMRAAA